MSVMMGGAVPAGGVVGGGYAAGGGYGGAAVGGGYAAGGVAGGVGGIGGGGVAVGGGSATGGGAGCCGAGADAGCGGGVQTGGAMSYVGSGGSYTLETTYKYVGAGAGTHEVGAVVAPSRWPMICGLLALVLVILVVVLWTSTVYCPLTTTTMSPPTGPPKSCLLWGDPHMQTFDGSFPNFYAQGEFWVVKSEQVSIQARYMATPFTQGLAATHQMVVGGAFMDGHRFAVGPIDNGEITCDDVPILQGFPSSATCGPITVSYNGHGTLVDDAQSHLEKRIVHIDHPEWGVHVQVMRWANHLNARITMMPRQAGQDGTCGNFNSDPNDDSSAAITNRLGGRIPVGELLFHRQTQASGAVTKTIADCEMSKRDHAVKLCKGSAPKVGGVLLDSCVFDVCFGGDQYAAEDGLSEGQVQG